MSSGGIEGLGRKVTGGLPPLEATQQARGGDKPGGFADLIERIAEEANRAQLRSDRVAEALASGQPTDLHEVMIALSEADISFRMLVEVRNRIVEAYQEIQRMPV